MSSNYVTKDKRIANYRCELTFHLLGPIAIYSTINAIGLVLMLAFLIHQQLLYCQTHQQIAKLLLIKASTESFIQHTIPEHCGVPCFVPGIGNRNTSRQLSLSSFQSSDKHRQYIHNLIVQ